jgi:hypothetical protein
MGLQVGDWVRVQQSGETGKVVHVSGVTAFVAFRVPGRDDVISAFLISNLTKVEPPENASPDSQ